MKFTPSHKHTCPNCQQLFKSSELIEKPAKGSEKTIFYVHPDKHCPHCQQKLGQVWDDKFVMKFAMVLISLSVLMCVPQLVFGMSEKAWLIFCAVCIVLIISIFDPIFDRNTRYKKLDE